MSCHTCCLVYFLCSSADYTFMGSLIIREVIKDLIPKGIKQAKVVMLTGTRSVPPVSPHLYRDTPKRKGDNPHGHASIAVGLSLFSSWVAGRCCVWLRPNYSACSSAPLHSAGGTGVLLNVDRVASQLGQLGAEAHVRGLVDSGWFLESQQQQQLPQGCPETISCSPEDAIKKGLRSDPFFCQG